jgi:hypothetical protein
MPRLLSPLGCREVVRVLDDVYIGQDNESLLHPLIEDRKVSLELFLGIDNREHDRAIM